MKKSLYAIIVIVLGVIGAKAWAAKLDVNVQKTSIEILELSSTNGTSRGCKKIN